MISPAISIRPGISSCLYKQANRADVLKARCRDVPAARACRLPAHLQNNIRKQPKFLHYHCYRLPLPL